MLEIASLSTPFNVLSGDRFEQHGTMVLQIRRIDNRDVVVKSATIVGKYSLATGAISVVGTSAKVNQVVLEKNVPGSTDSILRVTEALDHKVTIQFSSGNNETYDSWADLGSVADELDTDGALCRKLLKAMMFRSSPGGENKTACVGASVTTNIQPSAVPVIYTPPQE